jgi:hypothetical protein
LLENFQPINELILPLPYSLNKQSHFVYCFVWNKTDNQYHVPNTPLKFFVRASQFILNHMNPLQSILENRGRADIALYISSKFLVL